MKRLLLFMVAAIVVASCAKEDTLKVNNGNGVTPALLGKNGDFGYATTDENGKFVLTHATSNIWLNI